MIVSRTNVLVSGEPSDVHARLDSSYRTDPLTHAITITETRPTVAFCGVYVRPVGPVPGYWYFPEPQDARTLLTALGVMS